MARELPPQNHDEEVIFKCAQRIAEIDAERAKVVRERDLAICNAIQLHAPAAHIARLAKLTPTRVGQIVEGINESTEKP